jgi:hypothetical protein
MKNVILMWAIEKDACGLVDDNLKRMRLGRRPKEKNGEGFIV